MAKNEITNIVIDGNQAVICTEVFQQEPQRLTPTGKISHAKTRVYTQRYRTEWEQMPDFKGWLTSVPDQVTRAFCTYCKKNLHAHRLSLLKHTCTMKHQRAALMYQAEMNEKKVTDTQSDDKSMDYNPQYDEINVQLIKTHDTDEEENEDENEYEYVVERLEPEADECSDLKNDHDYGDDESENENYQLKLDRSDNEDIPSSKKMKLEPNEHTDKLAEAMAHVHGEYIDNDDNQSQQTNMVVDLDNHELLNNSNDKSVVENNNSKMKLKILEENGKKSINTNDDDDDDDNITVANRSISSEPKLVAYQINSQLSSAIGQSQSPTTLTISPVQNKRIMLSTGKTVTLTTGKLPAGYVLSKVKGNLPTLVMTGSGNKVMSPRAILPKLNSITSPTSSQSQCESMNDDGVPGPSNSSDTKMTIGKNISTTPARISTHVMDTSKGMPIGGLQVSLYKLMDGRWTFLNESTTSPSGRCTDLVDMKKSQITAGRYKIHFDVDKYFTLRRIETMYPFIEIVFDVKNPTGNYHIPILLSPFSYTTYRGTER